MTIISIKDGANIGGLLPTLFASIQDMATLWCRIFPNDKDGLTITSGSEGHPGDGVHMKDSLHYHGQAIDIRVRDVDNVIVVKSFLPQLKELLPDHLFDIVNEGDHIHIEYDPE